IEDDDGTLPGCTFADSRDDCWINRRAFDHVQAFTHGVPFDGLTVPSANIDIDAYNFAMPKEFKQRRVVDDRTAMGNARLDDEIGANVPDDLLHRHHVLWKLDDRAPHPGEVVGVFVWCDFAYPDA